MAYQIIVTEAFEESITKTTDWLIFKWPKTSALKFEIKLKTAIKKTSVNPKIGRLSARQNDIRSILISRHNRLYFQVFTNKIALLKLVETKQSPHRNKFE